MPTATLASLTREMNRLKIMNVVNQYRKFL